MQSIDYITYNDLYGGIYQSQVIDVVHLLREEFKVDISLKAFVPLKLWKDQSKKIKEHYPEAKVYPILGRVSDISRTTKVIKGSSRVAICRGPLAFKLAEKKYSKLIYDGRAAVKAEVEEYNVAGSDAIGQLLVLAEREAVEKAHTHIAVSNELVTYWRDELDLKFDFNKVVVIPCSLSSRMNDNLTPKIDQETVTVVYSGGTGPWQSFDMVTTMLAKALVDQSNLRVLFLTKPHGAIDQLVKQFPERVERKWLKHHEVNEVLSSCDYGILVRDICWTNRVASPVKFAEYLNAGLKVLISDELGDYSEVVKNEGLGMVVRDRLPELIKLNADERDKCKGYCAAHLTKSSETIRGTYQQLLSLISNA